jgi:opacity protein-like surface antigen
MRNLDIGMAFSAASHNVKDVPGIDDRNTFAFNGLSFGLTYRLMDRQVTGIGLAISAEPWWVRVDDTTGEPINGYGAEFVLAADREIIPDRLVGVLNLRFEPQVAQSRFDGTWSRESMIGGGGLMIKLQDNIFAGLEGRYLSNYATLDFSELSGQAFFLGPSVAVLFDKSWFTLGWNPQIVGRATENRSRLDLINFNRHVFRLTLGMQF